MYTYIFHNSFIFFYRRRAEKTSVFHIPLRGFPLLLVDIFRRTCDTEDSTTKMQFILKRSPVMIKIGEKLKSLRNERKMTQKDLAEKLNVSAQAVSRWENDEVEPSLETLGQLATIFDVSVDELFGKEPPVRQSATDSAAAPDEARADVIAAAREEARAAIATQAPVLGVCEDCSKPLYKAQDIVRIRHEDSAATVLCVNCDAKRKIRQATLEREELTSDRRRSWIWSSVAAVAFFLLSIIAAFAPEKKDPSLLLIGLGGSVLILAFVFCCILDNTFVGEMWSTIAHWGFVDMPGVIFSLDFDGIVFLIATKILFAILGFLLAVASVVFATALGLVIGIFAFPFAILINQREIAEQTREIQRWEAVVKKAA